MNVAVRQSMTLEEFIAWEDRQELRYEFDGARVHAMVGGTAAHSSIQVNVITALATRLRGSPCRVQGSHLKVQANGRIRYPDAFVVCAPVPATAKVVTDPVIVFEVLSDGSAEEDLGVKNADYRATPSVKRYVILQQSHAGAIIFSRDSDRWLSELVTGSDGVLPLPEIEVELPMSELYAGVELTGYQVE